MERYVLETDIDNTVERAETDYQNAVGSFERIGKAAGGGLAGSGAFAGTLALFLEHPGPSPEKYATGSAILTGGAAAYGGHYGEKLGRRVGEAVTGAEPVDYDEEALYEAAANHADVEGILSEE